jgi:hypothetical protein
MPAFSAQGQGHRHSLDRGLQDAGIDLLNDTGIQGPCSRTLAFTVHQGPRSRTLSVFDTVFLSLSDSLAFEADGIWRREMERMI